jgi:hypothetical protein
VISSVLAVLQYLGFARELSPWVNQPVPGDAFANLRQRNQFATLCSMGLALIWWWVQHGQALGAQAGARVSVQAQVLVCIQEPLQALAQRAWSVLWARTYSQTGRPISIQRLLG